MSSDNQKKIVAKKRDYNFTYSVRCAWRGFRYALKHEKNLRIEISIAILTVLLMIIFSVRGWEAIILFLMMAWVIVAEFMNTAVERLVDIVTPRFHPYAKIIKDIMAAAVLISAITSIIVAGFIFGSYIKKIFF